MKIRLNTGESITAILAAGAATTNPKAIVTREGRGGITTDVVALTDDTAVDLLASVDAAGDFLTGLSLCNIDTASITLTLNKKISGTSYPIIKSMVLAVGDTLVMGEEWNVLDSSGNVKMAFASATTTFTGDVTLSTGHDLIFDGTTGQSEIHVPDNLADALSLKIAAGADLLQFDTSTGAIVINVGATVRLNVLGDAQIGSATTDLLAFHGMTPTDQCAAYTQTFSTADRTHAARTATALTVTDGAGTNNGTIDAITADASVIAAVQELAAMINKVIVDLADTAGVVNAVVDDLQEKGLVG